MAAKVQTTTQKLKKKHTRIVLKNTCCDCACYTKINVAKSTKEEEKRFNNKLPADKNE